MGAGDGTQPLSEFAGRHDGAGAAPRPLRRQALPYGMFRCGSSVVGSVKFVGGSGKLCYICSKREPANHGFDAKRFCSCFLL